MWTDVSQWTVSLVCWRFLLRWKISVLCFQTKVIQINAARHVHDFGGLFVRSAVQIIHKMRSFQKPEEVVIMSISWRRCCPSEWNIRLKLRDGCLRRAFSILFAATFSVYCTNCFIHFWRWEVSIFPLNISFHLYIAIKGKRIKLDHYK